MKKAVGVAALTVTALGLLAYLGKLSPLLSSGYLPHRFCYLAQPWLVWTNVTTDGLIAASYGAIFCCLFWVASRLRRLPEIKAYVWIFVAFGTFILACGATHAMEIVTVWWPVYPLSAVVKMVCAAASVPTAILFAWVTPKLAESAQGFVSTLSTSQQEKEQAMRALIASEKLAVAGRISAAISHEIKNPLHTLGDVLYLLANDPRIPTDTHDLLEKLESELERAKSIAESTLSLYRESGHPAPVLLSSLAQSVLDLQRPEFIRRNISIESRMRTPNPLTAYSSELRQILINLIQNAIDAVDRDSRIVVRIQPRTLRAGASAATAADKAEGFAQAALKPLPGYSITIADAGAGIDAKHRQRLFALFFTTKGEQGTGLGLWLVRSMVEKQGGRIRFRSRTASESAHPGTVFNIWIPIGPASLGLPAGAAALAASRNGDVVSSA
jgi:signal transduction histidine kinase